MLAALKKATQNLQGNLMVAKIDGFMHDSYHAYNQILKAGPRSLFAPFKVKENVSQHMDTVLHLFKNRISKKTLFD